MNNILVYCLFPVTAAIIVGMIMSRIFRDEEKKDKGFVLFYHKLTYRRRMIRTLWNIPIIFLLFLVINWIGYLNSNEYIAIGIILLLIVLIEFIYNYVKWKKVERKVASIDKKCT
jgi:cell division protein FtsW (lipid II flippase)